MLRRFYFSMDISMDTTHTHIHTHNSTHTHCIIHVHCHYYSFMSVVCISSFSPTRARRDLHSPAEETEEISRSTVFTCYCIFDRISIE